MGYGSDGELVKCSVCDKSGPSTPIDPLLPSVNQPLEVLMSQLITEMRTLKTEQTARFDELTNVISELRQENLELRKTIEVMRSAQTNTRSTKSVEPALSLAVEQSSPGVSNSIVSGDKLYSSALVGRRTEPAVNEVGHTTPSNIDEPAAALHRMRSDAPSTLVSANADKPRRSRKRTVCLGTGDSNNILKPYIPDTAIVVSRLSTDVTSDALRSYILSKLPECRISSITQLPVRTRTYNCFKIELPGNVSSSMLDAGLWPCGVMVRRFFRGAGAREAPTGGSES